MSTRAPRPAAPASSSRARPSPTAPGNEVQSGPRSLGWSLQTRLSSAQGRRAEGIDKVAWSNRSSRFIQKPQGYALSARLRHRPTERADTVNRDVAQQHTGGLLEGVLSGEAGHRRQRQTFSGEPCVRVGGGVDGRGRDPVATAPSGVVRGSRTQAARVAVCA